MNTTEQIRAITSGKGVQHLLDEAYKIFGNPIVMFDTDYDLIAYTKTDTDDPIWNEIVTTGTFCYETQVFFMNECFTDIVANADTIAKMTSDKLKYDRILGNICNHDNIKVANIVMIECQKRFEPDTPVAFEALAGLFSKEISADEFYIGYGEAYQDALIKRLIDRNLEDNRLYSPHVKILYDGFMANLYLAVIDTSHCGQNYGPAYFRDMFRKKEHAFKYAVYSDYAVIIISTNYKEFDAERDLRGLKDLLEQYNLYAGISRGFENLFALQVYYNEAAAILKEGLKNNGRGRVYLCG